jgi:hypothetical protein
MIGQGTQSVKDPDEPECNGKKDPEKRCHECRQVKNKTFLRFNNTRNPEKKLRKTPWPPLHYFGYAVEYKQTK